MASFIKKQILKHLTKFTKNLSADKINLSTLRGEGELTNLELDCDALQNLMNLPTWLKIENARCNRVHVKIPWTKLKTTPITILLDAVELQMIACEEPRPPNGPSPIQASASSGDTSYGFTVKVLEGITVNINSITVDFKSPFFNANLQLSQLLLESTNPKWKRSDLKHTYIHDKNLDQVLTFKKLSWQTMRIVANAVNSTERKNSATPLRLITNQSEIMITFRRKASDCSIIASCLHIHFDDLLWVLTDSQVQSAMLCMKALRDMMERSNQQMRKHNLQSQETNVQPQPTPSPKQVNSREEAKEEQYGSKLFHDYLILESSFHIDFDNVDLHVCEEASSDSMSGLHGGAIQLSLRALKIDHYPYHKPASDRNHFRDYGEVMRERDSWASTIIKKFRKEFAMLREAARSCGNLNATGQEKKSPRLVENCTSVRLSDIEIHQVTMEKSKNQGSGHLIRSTRKELHLPDEMLLFHFIHTKYYYPDGRDFPAPSDNTFMQINAPLVHAHWDTLIWLNRLASVTVKAVQKMLEDLGFLPNSEEDSMSNGSSNDQKAEDEAPHVDVRIQLLMPKIFVPGPIKENSSQPLGLEIQASKATVTNCREGFDCHRQQLCDTLDSIGRQHLAKCPDAFPSDTKIDMPHLEKLLKEHSLSANSAFNQSFNEKNVFLKRNSLIDLAKDDVWSVNVDNIWIDFIMPLAKEKSSDKRMSGFLASKDACSDAPYIEGEKNPFMDSFPAQIWIGKSTLPEASSQQIAMHAKQNIVAKPCSSIEKLCSKDCLNTSEFKSSIEDVSLDSNNSSPRIRNMRNRKLRDYYQSLEPKTESSSFEEKSEERNCSEVITTYILLHTTESLRLQVDHHQYVFLMNLLDMIEDVEKKLEESSNVPSLSELSPCPSPDHASTRTQNTKAKPVETTSIRIAAPFADLFLILEPEGSGKNSIGDPEKSQRCNSETVSLISDTVPLTREAKLQEFTDKIRDRMGITNQVTTSNQESPMWSDNTSESVSIQDSENNVSVSGESYAYDEASVQENTSPVKVPFIQESKSGIISSSPSNQSVLSDKSLVSDESRPAFLSENQMLSIGAPINKDIAKLGKLKSGSSGYESSSCESLPNRENGTKVANSHRRYRSRESSIASDDQFVMIQVERKGTVDSIDSTAVRFVKDEVHLSSICGDSSSLSSQTAPINNTTPADSEFDSKEPSVSESMQDTKDFINQRNKIGETDDVRVIPEELPSCSVVVLHISNGVEIAVDSNDSESSVVKLNALTVNAAELGLMERHKAYSVFDKYSCKKIRKLWSEQPFENRGTETPNFSLRVDTGPLAGRFSSLAAENGYIQLTASSVLLALKASTLGSFGGFFEEEGPSKITPMLIKASDVELAIEGETSSDPQIPPEIISLLVHSATISRTDDGTFHINSISAGNTEVTDLADANPEPAVLENSPSDESFSTYTDTNWSKHSIATNNSLCSNPTEETPVSNHTVDFLEEKVSKMKSVIENLRNDLQLVQSQKESVEKELCLLKERSNSSE